MSLGQFATDGTQDADLGKVYRCDNGFARYVKLASQITNAGGTAVFFAYTLGVPTYTVDTTTTSHNVNFAGVIPIALDIASTTTLAASTRLMVRINGPCSVKASDTLVTTNFPLAAGTSAGALGQSTYVSSAAIPAYIGYATNTAVATAVGQLITCVLTRAA